MKNRRITNFQDPMTEERLLKYIKELELELARAKDQLITEPWEDLIESDPWSDEITQQFNNVIDIEINKDNTYYSPSKTEQAIYCKSNVLVNAYYDLGLRARQLVIWIAALAQHKDINEVGQLNIEIKVSEFANFFGINSDHAYNIVKDLVIQLQRKVLTFYPNKNTEISVAVLTKGIYYKDQGRAIVRIDEDLVPHIFDIKGSRLFADVNIVSVLTTNAATFFYERLKREFDLYVYNNKRDKIANTKIDIEEIRAILGLQGKYKVPTDLKRRIIDPAIEEINKNTDLRIQYEAYKTGRRISGYKFYIQKNEDKLTAEQQIRNKLRVQFGYPTAKNRELVELLKNYKISAPQAERRAIEIENRYSQAQIFRLERETLPRMAQQFENLKREGRATVNLGGYINAALKKEFQIEPK